MASEPLTAHPTASQRTRLANYTLHTPLNPGETMDIGSAVPDGANVVAFLFQEYGRFKVRGRPAGVLLCIGITSHELALCRRGKRKVVEQALRDHGVYPFTDLYRESVLTSPSFDHRAPNIGMHPTANQLGCYRKLAVMGVECAAGDAGR